MVDDIKKQIGSGVVALVNTADGKVSLVVGVTDDLTGRLDAVALVKAGAAPAAKTVAGVTFAGRLLSDVPAKDLKGMADEIKTQIGSGVVALVNTADGKVSLVVGVTDDLKGTHDAVALVRAGSAAVGGKGGGGRPDMAQAGGPDADKAPDALAAIEAALGGG
jgi:alanyl-tRNA synthetase